MSLLEFVSKNPDLVTLVVTTVGGLIWHRGRSLKLSDLWDTLLKLGHQALPVLLSDPKLFDDEYVRSKISAAIWKGLERLKVPRNATTEKLVDEATEHIKGELAEQLWKLQMGKFVETSEQTLDILKKAQAAP